MRLRERQKAALRDRILEVCGRLFRTHGFDDTTISDITAEVGISRQTFFNHFSGKDAVLTQLGLAWLREQAAVPRLDARRRAAGSDRPRGAGETRGGQTEGAAVGSSILAGARQAVLAQMRAVAADADFMRLVFTRSGVLFPQASSPAGRLGADQARPLFDNLALVMAAARDAGEIRPDIDPLQVAELYVSTMLMTARLWLVDYWGEGVDLEARAARALDVLERGLAPADPDIGSISSSDED